MFLGIVIDRYCIASFVQHETYHDCYSDKFADNAKITSVSL